MAQRRIVFFDFGGTLANDNARQLIPTDVIKTLGQNYQLVIVSGASDASVAQFLELHSLQEYFMILKNGLFSKSKTQRCTEFLHTHGLTSGDTIFITDSVRDIEEVLSMGIKSVAVTWGLGPAEDLRAIEPYELTVDPHSLPEIINEYFLQK